MGGLKRGYVLPPEFGPNEWPRSIYLGHPNDVWGIKYVAERQSRMKHGQDGWDFCGTCHAMVFRRCVSNATDFLPVRFCPNCGVKVMEEGE